MREKKEDEKIDEKFLIEKDQKVKVLSEFFHQASHTNHQENGTLQNWIISIQ